MTLPVNVAQFRAYTYDNIQAEDDYLLFQN